MKEMLWQCLYAIIKILSWQIVYRAITSTIHYSLPSTVRIVNKFDTHGLEESGEKNRPAYKFQQEIRTATHLSRKTEWPTSFSRKTERLTNFSRKLEPLTHLSRKAEWPTRFSRKTERLTNFSSKTPQEATSKTQTYYCRYQDNIKIKPNVIE